MKQRIMCAMDQIFMAFSIVNIHKMVFHAATMGNSGRREKFRINYGQIPGYTVPFNKDDAHVAYHVLFKSRDIIAFGRHAFYMHP
jgi:hypothetical protein